MEMMPILSNPRHEEFAQGLAQGKPASTAYEEAGYRANDGNCIRLKGNERVLARVAELQGQGAERAVVTLQSLIDEAGDIQTRATAKGQYSAAVAALTAKAKLSGHWVDYSDNKNSNVTYVVRDEPLTEAEWEEQFCRPAIEDQRHQS